MADQITLLGSHQQHLQEITIQSGLAAHKRLADIKTMNTTVEHIRPPDTRHPENAFDFPTLRG
ncbi:hypothetical protein [uncultured Cohaesibacter sp.]|uniref:hypothetical protein n=1 Tax=uncultured Cohaesibacter sp. TaxID=1002546 RepID=UPI0037484142